LDLHEEDINLAKDLVALHPVAVARDQRVANGVGRGAESVELSPEYPVRDMTPDKADANRFA